MPIAARLLALAGAVLMPVSLFLDWYEVNTGDGVFDLKGWDAFETTDALMVLSAIAVVLLLVVIPVYVGRALMIVGALTAGFIAVQLVDKPAILGFLDRSALSLEVGAWLGLLGALLVVAAGALTTRATGD